MIITKQMLNIFSARLIQAVCAKTACSHMSLCEHNSSTKSARELFKRLKEWASRVVCHEKNFFGDFRFLS